MNEELNRLLEITRPRATARRAQAVMALSPQGRWLLRAFLGFLAVTALFGLAAILGGHFSDFDGKVLISTITISLGSLCGLASFEYARRSGNSVFGGASVLLAWFAALLIINGIWAEPSNSEGYWKTTAVLAVFAAACAHFFGLCLVRLNPSHQWVLVVAGIAIFALAAVISGMILNSFNHDAGTYKLIAALAIVDLAATIAIPILHRLDRTDSAALAAAPGDTSAERFMVTLQSDGTYRSDDGRVLTVLTGRESRK